MAIKVPEVAVVKLPTKACVVITTTRALVGNGIWRKSCCLKLNIMEDELVGYLLP